MGSYHRKCSKCGRLIQMRQMPQGQWVAFEGYDTPHDCHQARTKSVTRPAQSSAQTDTSRAKQPHLEEEVQQPQDIMTLLSQALARHNVVTIRYDSKGFRKTTRDIEPINSDGIFCHAYCRLRQDFRTFRISRISNMTVHDETYVPRELPTVPAASSHSQDNYPSRRSEPAIPTWLWWAIGLIFLWWISRKH